MFLVINYKNMIIASETIDNLVCLIQLSTQSWMSLRFFRRLGRLLVGGWLGCRCSRTSARASLLDIFRGSLAYSPNTTHP